MSVDESSGFTVGRTFSKVLVSDLKRTQLVQYAGASGDYNPLHTDEVYAREVGGFPGVFAHGMLTMAMTGSLVSDVVGIENVTQFGGRFKAQVWPGDTLTAYATIVAAAEDEHGRVHLDLSVSTVNQLAVEVFSGTARAVVGIRES
jgi:acyl dehydratase